MAQEQDQSATHAIAQAAANGSSSGSGPETASRALVHDSNPLAAQQTAQQEDDPTSVLAGFKLERVLDQDAKTRSAVLLGSFAPQQAGGEEEKAVVLLEKTHFEPAFFEHLGDVVEGASTASTSKSLQHLSKLVRLGQNDVYNWLMAWRSEGHTTSVPADMKINVIRPATPAHISKYERQEKILVRETPEMYARLVRPWIEGQPAARINWVYNILEGKKEKENVLFRDEDPVTGFVILPDLKWDRRTLSSLYLISIVQDRSLRSLRSLCVAHIPLLRKIQKGAAQVAHEHFGLGASPEEASGKLRCFVHYQPSYYHLHVHVLSVDYTSHQGAIVGQAHLLDDIIDLLQMGVKFEERTLGYAIGERHELVGVLREAGILGSAAAEGSTQAES
ncbi:scavenger mRNA decapping enzyme [Microstroma glucosiphilum]|uniref:Scavenger mRNA decapping enzyme n=1 Tax=Pseudomicrostroma glucosiphilum TaxID=1684307 RepID=A0A316TYK3_9BASI|nr:scavenger mRNA decapping enzyme [Pseudomicrostroma glucosiphilum]PWN18227.1 scavenger mRNA decapping enzyme [Pseudomicrostroma glucosiphilum]